MPHTSIMETIISELAKPTNILLLLATFLAYKVIYQVFLWPYLLSPLRNVPGPPVGNHLIGQLATIIREEPAAPQTRWADAYGPVVRTVGPVGLERIMFTRPEALHKILVADWLENPRPGFMRDILGLVAGYGLLTVTGNEHKQMRKAMNPAFSIPNLSAQVESYYETIDGLVEIMNAQITSEADPSKGKEMLMYEWMSKATLDIICETAFGYKTDSLHNPHNELAVAYEELVGLQSAYNIAKLLPLILTPGLPALMASEWAYNHRHWAAAFPWLKPIATLMQSMHHIKRISAQMLKDKLADAAVVADGGEGKKDIMSLLVRARMADKGEGYQMSDGAMMDQVLTFLGAGHETTASGMAWTLWLLAKSPEAQDKLRAEVTPVLDADPHPSYRALKEMSWLDCIVMESLRLMPPVPMTLRSASKDQWIDGVLVPKGTIHYIPIKVINTWKVLWGQDADEFKPERWLNLPKEYNSTFSVLSFIAGPHACIGKTMSIVEMKAVTAALVKNFVFEPAYEGQVPKPTAAITMKPADGMPLRVRMVQSKNKA
ncbi:cytochrome P450 [Athelia psychrophila]|uniref:Cytochrome P450 n=1 Tax=Athelia psychrophila TaxID=1759441 RepID=A0A166CWY7_9AGAM|nr:cytochrome P450 [Fibularhizoctonia sp. CBS 109695]